MSFEEFWHVGDTEGSQKELTRIGGAAFQGTMNMVSTEPHPTSLGFPPAQVGSPANFAGLQLHGVPLAGASPLRDPYGALAFQNMTPNPAGRPGSLY
jgi:hypothetical protein